MRKAVFALLLLALFNFSGCLLWFGIVVLTVSALADNRIPDGDLPFYFRPVSGILSLNEPWHLFVSIDIRAIQNDYSETLQGYQKLVTEITETEILSWHYSLEPVKQDIERLRQGPIEIDEELRQLQSLLRVRRTARGLQNLGDKLIDFLFVNPDADDALQWQKQLATLEQRQNLLFHEHSLRMSATHSVQLHLQEVAAHFRNATSATRDAFNNMPREESYIHDPFFHNTYFLESTKMVASILTLESHINTLENFLIKTLERLRALTEAVQSLAEGRLHPRLVRPTDLGTILEAAQEHLPNGTTWALNEWQIYGLRSAAAAIQNGTIHIRIRIPLVRLKWGEPQLYEVLRLPKLVGPEGQSVVVQKESSYLVGFPKSGLHQLWEVEDIQRCVPGNQLLCPMWRPLDQAPGTTCIGAAWLRDVQNMKRLCKWNVVGSQKRLSVFWQPSQQVWRYFAHNPTSVNEVCDGFEGNESSSLMSVSLNGVGVLRTHRGCTWNWTTGVLPYISERNVVVQKGLENLGDHWNDTFQAVKLPPSADTRSALEQLRRAGDLRWEEDLEIAELDRVDDLLATEWWETPSYQGTVAVVAIVLAAIWLLSAVSLHFQRRRIQWVTAVTSPPPSSLQPRQCE